MAARPLPSEQAKLPYKASAVNLRRSAMSFGIYAVGFAIVIGGLIYAAYLMHMPAHWIAVCAIVLLGVGIVKAVTATRQKDH